MIIEKQNIKVKDLVNGYFDDEEEGVVAYGELLNVRPKYQREFVYEAPQEKAVIDTILKGYPLSLIYWVKNPDGTYEVLDGQQRILSICRFFSGKFFVDYYGQSVNANNLRQTFPEAYQNFLNYELEVRVCVDGTTTEQLEWFKTINIAGLKLTEQELRNINYTGEWLTSAKRYFSKKDCPAKQVANDYLVKKNYNRQGVLEMVLKWITDCEGTSKKNEQVLCEYMGKHQSDTDANELIDYFTKVIRWVKTTFEYNSVLMDEVEWGLLYNRFSDVEIDIEELHNKIRTLMADPLVENKKGIYWYVFDNDATHLNRRSFSQAIKLTVWAQQEHKCNICGKKLPLSEMEADHIVPWSKGGSTTIENCQMLCKQCNRDKSSSL